MSFLVPLALLLGTTGKGSEYELVPLGIGFALTIEQRLVRGVRRLNPNKRAVVRAGDMYQAATAALRYISGFGDRWNRPRF